MARKHRLKKHADNPFTKLTGKPVIKLTGSSSCIVTSGKMIKVPQEGIIKQTNVKVVAALLYLKNPDTLLLYDLPPILDPLLYNEYTVSPEDIKVTQSCGVDQCVNIEHLIVEIKKSNTW